ncbi:hypothetical protein EON66_11005 [archaeon]|nr:MAG: hypothetical protein EON66_11005 [archaeon]
MQVLMEMEDYPAAMEDFTAAMEHEKYALASFCNKHLASFVHTPTSMQSSVARSVRFTAALVQVGIPRAPESGLVRAAAGTTE